MTTVATASNYAVYIRKLKEGEHKSIRERLSVLPNDSFKRMYEEVLQKSLIETGSRQGQIDELILELETIGK
jgi:hypothetical protein